MLRVCAGTIKLKGEHWQKEPSFCAEARRNSEEAAAAKAAMKEEGTDVSGSRSITVLFGAFVKPCELSLQVECLTVVRLCGFATMTAQLEAQRLLSETTGATSAPVASGP